MKIILCLFFLFLFNISSLLAQKDSVETKVIQPYIDACITFRNAISDNNLELIKQSAIQLENCYVTDFSDLYCIEGENLSVNGHIVFNDIFAKALAEGKDIYANSDEYNYINPKRGQYADGKIRSKTVFICANSSCVYAFSAKGHQELAVIAEAGGLISLKVLVTNRDGLEKRFDDVDYVKSGRPYRKKSFELPHDRKNNVLLEVFNCSKNDCSFVIISN